MDDPGADPIVVHCPRCKSIVVLTGTPPVGICSACLAIATYIYHPGGGGYTTWVYSSSGAEDAV